MLRPEQVPDVAVAAARDAWLKSDVNAEEDWRSAIAAAINGWPGMVCYPPDPLDEVVNPERVILPLTQEEKSE